MERISNLKQNEYLIDTEGLAEQLLKKGQIMSSAWATNQTNGKSYEVEYKNKLFKINAVGLAKDEITRLR